MKKIFWVLFILAAGVLLYKKFIDKDFSVIETVKDAQPSKLNELNENIEKLKKNAQERNELMDKLQNK